MPGQQPTRGQYDRQFRLLIAAVILLLVTAIVVYMLMLYGVIPRPATVILWRTLLCLATLFLPLRITDIYLLATARLRQAGGYTDKTSQDCVCISVLIRNP